MVKINIINKSKNKLPEYATKGSAGCDLRANLDGAIVLNPGERKLVGTGLYIELPEGYEAQVRPRSGLAMKFGITCVNSPGTIDSDYRGEVGVELINLGNMPVTIKNGDRIAQMVISRYSQAEFNIVSKLSETERGEGGYGHTGIK